MDFPKYVSNYAEQPQAESASSCTMAIIRDAALHKFTDWRSPKLTSPISRIRFLAIQTSIKGALTLGLTHTLRNCLD